MNDRLRLFCTYYGFEIDLLSGDDRYSVEITEPVFDGRIDAIRLIENGRFGNVFYQILNAVLLARHLRCRTIELFPFQAGPPEGSYEVGGFMFICAREHNSSLPTLVGHFFNSYAFQSALTGFDPDVVVELVDGVLRPLFCHLSELGPQNSGTLVMNFRGGDVFGNHPIPKWYLQPPASYYVKAALFARERLGVERVKIVSEDRSNPALAVTEAQLLRHGLGVVFQSASLENDISVLLSARHLVSPFGTLCEALAMLSTCLQSYFAFRQFESHRHIHARRPELLTHVLNAHDVRLVRIRDPMHNYIPPLSWQRTDAQIRMMRDFPIESLEVQDLSRHGDDTDDCFIRFPSSAITTPATEAYRLRQAVIALRAEVAALRAVADEVTVLRAVADAAVKEVAGFRNSVSWRVTAPIRWAARNIRQLGSLAAAAWSKSDASAPPGRVAPGGK